MVTAQAARSLILLADLVRQVRDRHNCPVERASDIIQAAAISTRPALFVRHTSGRVQTVDPMDFSVWMNMLRPFWSFEGQESAARFSGDPRAQRLPHRNPSIAADAYLTWSRNNKNPGQWLAVSKEAAKGLMSAAARELVTQEPSARPKWSAEDLQILVDEVAKEVRIGSRGARGRVVKRFHELFPHRPAISSVTGLNGALEMAKRHGIGAASVSIPIWVPAGIAE